MKSVIFFFVELQLYSDAYTHVAAHIIMTTRAGRGKSKLFKYSYDYRSSDSIFRKLYSSGTGKYSLQSKILF